MAGVASWPHAAGYFHTPPGSVFVWSADPGDNNSYFAKMRTGYRGEWLTTNLYSSEPHPRVLLFPFHVILGRLAALYRDLLKWLTGQAPPAYVTMPAIYQATRFTLTAVLMAMVYWLAGMATTRPARRLWIVALTAFAAGSWAGGLNTEGSVLLSCARFPHFTFSLALYVLACGAFVAAMKHPERRRRCAVWGAAAGLGLGWTHPFDVPALGAIGAAALLWRWAQTRRFPPALFAGLVSFWAFAAFPVLYMGWAKWRSPVLAAIDAQNSLVWAHWWEPAWMLREYLILAAAGTPFLWIRRRDPAAMFVIVWLAVGLCATMAPSGFQRRVIEGLPIALAFGASALVEGGLYRPMIHRWKRNPDESRLPPAGAYRPDARRRRLLRHGCFLFVLLVLSPRTHWLLQSESAEFTAGAALCYIDKENVDAMRWLENRSDWREVVWAQDRLGNAIPFLSGNRVFIGHNRETVDYLEKRALTQRLFSGDMGTGEFLDIVRRYGIHYLYVSRSKRGGRSGAPSVSLAIRELLGKPAYANGGVEIFRLEVP